MKAIQLTGFNGLQDLQLVQAPKPTPGRGQVLIEVKAAGVNFAELELTKGRYSVGKAPPFLMGFEAAGVVAEVGAGVHNFRAGDRITAIVSSGGYAEYATAETSAAMPIPDHTSFAEASTIPIQGLSAYTLLKFAAKPLADETIMVQAAAGGVGLYLVQLAKIMGVKKVIALASRKDKLELVTNLGADVAIDYTDKSWSDKVRETTGARGVDIVLEAASGEVGEESFKLTAPFGRIVLFGAKNIHDTFGPQKIQQVIYKNQTVTGFNFPSLPPELVANSASELLALIRQQKIRLFADTSFPLEKVRSAFEALASRKTIGKVVLTP